MASDRLPPDTLAEIFSRLPVKSLLRFRSTSKSLKSIIDSHNFINLHLKNSLNRSFILRLRSNIYQIEDDFSNLTTAVPLNHPFTRNSTNIALIGSCNGLLAVSNGEIALRHPNAANEITIWNPNIRKHHIIPFLPLPITPRSPSDMNCSLCVHGFGFDPLTGDYKILRLSWLVSLQNPFYDPHVRLFSLKTNSWKVIPTMQYALVFAQTMGVLVEDSIHWIMAKKLDGLHPSLIVAFNLTLEIFNEVPLPDEIGEEEVNSNDSVEIDVAALGGCLCMTVNYETTKIDVWVMKQYGLKDSWCKLFTMMKSCVTSHLKSSSPLCYSSDGSKVLIEGIEVLLEVHHKKLFWYDLKTEQVSYEEIPDFNGAKICVGSLVPPSFPVDNSSKKENHTCKSKKRDDFLSGGFKLRL